MGARRSYKMQSNQVRACPYPNALSGMIPAYSQFSLSASERCKRWILWVLQPFCHAASLFLRWRDLFYCSVC